MRGIDDLMRFIVPPGDFDGIRRVQSSNFTVLLSSPLSLSLQKRPAIIASPTTMTTRFESLRGGNWRARIHFCEIADRPIVLVCQ